MLGERAGRRSPSGCLGSDADARVPLREEVGDFDQDQGTERFGSYLRSGTRVIKQER